VRARRSDLKSHDLLDAQVLGKVRASRLAVAVSGGSDSVALLLALNEVSKLYSLSLSVVHVNQKLRTSADDDEAFVRDLAGRLNLPFYSESRLDDGRRSEAELREFRYAVFTRGMERLEASAVALGHTSDDLAETVLMNLLRGCGLHGFGFRFDDSYSGLRVLRPLWNTPREQARQFLAEHNERWREDESNEQNIYTRNRIRNVLLPLLQREFNPEISMALVRTAMVLGSADEFIRAKAKRVLAHLSRKKVSQHVLPGNWLRRQPQGLASEVVRQWLQEVVPGQFVSFAKIEEVLNGLIAGSSRVTQLGGGMAVVCTGRALWFYRGRAEESFHAPGNLDLARVHSQIFSLPLAQFRQPFLLSPAKLPTVTLLNGTTLQIPIHVEPGREYWLRNRVNGDSLASGQSLKQVLVNDKVPFYVRDYLVLAVNVVGQIEHVVGLPRVNGRIAKALNDLAE